MSTDRLMRAATLLTHTPGAAQRGPWLVDPLVAEALAALLQRVYVMPETSVAPSVREHAETVAALVLGEAVSDVD